MCKNEKKRKNTYLVFSASLEDLIEPDSILLLWLKLAFCSLFRVDYSDNSVLKLGTNGSIVFLLPNI